MYIPRTIWPHGCPSLRSPKPWRALAQHDGSARHFRAEALSITSKFSFRCCPQARLGVTLTLPKPISLLTSGCYSFFFWGCYSFFRGTSVRAWQQSPITITRLVYLWAQEREPPSSGRTGGLALTPSAQTQKPRKFNEWSESQTHHLFKSQHKS